MKRFFHLLHSNAIIIFLLPITVPFFVFVRNLADTPVGAFIRASLVSIILFLILLVLMGFIFKESGKTILFSSIVFLALYLYGSLYDALSTIQSPLAHHKILVVLFLLVFVLLALLIKKIKISKNVNSALLISSVMFVLFQLIHLVPEIYNLNTKNSEISDSATTGDLNIDQALQPVKVTTAGGTPDVYYIILDMYARNDQIQQDFGFDNSAFTDELKKIGFFIGYCSRSNYMMTKPSLASSLNLLYLQDVSQEFTPENTNSSLLRTMIQHPAVIEQFKSLGYSVNAFETGFEFTEIRSVDHYYQPSKPIAFLGSINPYEILLLKNSIFKILFDTHIPLIDPLFNKLTFPYQDHVILQKYIFQSLVSISRDPQPTFTFAHVIIPHYPLIFRADGSYTTDRNYFSSLGDAPVSDTYYKDGYINQVEYVNQQVLDVVRQIISNSDTPPIIILQGDHGPNLDDRLPILNAYYFPNLENTGLYPSISPVNSFRLLFNDYFAGNYSILEDKSYKSSYEYFYDWSEAPETSPSCLNH